jgi:hypothetical protein
LILATLMTSVQRAKSASSFARFCLITVRATALTGRARPLLAHRDGLAGEKQSAQAVPEG